METRLFSVLSMPRIYLEAKWGNPVIIILGKVKPGIESIRGLNLAVVKHMTVQETRLS
jgi:hypothetical protein